MVVLEDGLCVYANPAFEQLSGYTFPELAAMESIFELVAPGERAEAAPARAGADRAGRRRHHLRVEIRRRDGRRAARAGRRAAGDRRAAGAAAARRRGARRDREGARGGRARAAAGARRADGRGERAVRPVARRGAHAAHRRRAVRARPRRHVHRRARDPPRARAPRHRGRPRARRASASSSRATCSRAHGDPVAEVLRTGAGAAIERPTGCSPWSPLLARGRVHGAIAAGFAELRPGAPRGGAGHARGPRPARRAGARQRAPVRRALRGRADAAAGAAPARPAADPRRPLAARYLAAGPANEVGGDFYDCFATGGGDWALVIGDVCGKGAEAAAITAIARYTLRAAVLHNPRPAGVLVELNEALLRQGLDYRFCTVLYASVTPRPEGGARSCWPRAVTRSRSCCAPAARWRRRAGPARCWASSRPGDLRGARAARARRRARALHGRRDRGEPGRRGARARAAGGAAAPAGGARRGRRSPRRWRPRRWPCRTAGCATTSPSSSCRCARTASRRRLAPPGPGVASPA